MMQLRLLSKLACCFALFCFVLLVADVIFMLHLFCFVGLCVWQHLGSLLAMFTTTVVLLQYFVAGLLDLGNLHFCSILLQVFPCFCLAA